MAQAHDLDEHDRQLIATLESAALRIDTHADGTPGRGVVSLAHLYGYYGIDVDDSAWPHRAYATIVAGGEVGVWPVGSFGDVDTDEAGCQRRALDHARQALGVALQNLAASVVASARARLGN